MPDTSPDFVLLVAAGLGTLALGWVHRARRGRPVRSDQRAHDPTGSNPAPSTGAPSISSQVNVSA